MAKRYEVTDIQWEIIKSYLGNIPKKTGHPVLRGVRKKISVK